MKKVEFHFDFGSPNAYLAHRAIPQIEQRTGARFEYVPVLLGGVFKATNNVSPVVSLQGVKNKPDYMRVETRRWLRRYQLDDFVMNPNFPVNTLHMMRGAMFAKSADYYADYIEAMYRAMWQEARKMDDPEEIASVLKAAGLPVQEILEGAVTQPVKQALIDSTSASVDRGTFGSPTFYFDDEIYFGKDSMRDLEDALLS